MTTKQPKKSKNSKKPRRATLKWKKSPKCDLFKDCTFWDANLDGFYFSICIGPELIDANETPTKSSVEMTAYVGDGDTPLYQDTLVFGRYVSIESVIDDLPKWKVATVGNALLKLHEQQDKLTDIFNQLIADLA